jgi:hypothetical protein
MIKKITQTLFNNVKMIAVLIAFFGFTTANAQYCIPGMNCTDGDLILNVEFAGIENTSNCSASGYGDYTEDVEPAQVEAGETYAMSVTVGAGWQFETVAVWIDFDNNETFDIDESYLLGTGSGSDVVGDIAIPADAAEGTYRMRISVLASDVPVEDPCYNDLGNFGEFEDYLVTVSEPLSTPDLDFSNSVSVFKTGETLNINSGTILGKVEVFDLTGKLIATQQNIASRNATIGIAATNQVLLVKVQSEEGYTTAKKVIF